MRGFASALILSILALAVAGCVAEPSGYAEALPNGGYNGPGYYSPYNVAPSDCGALGTCPVTNAVRITPYDMHSGE